MKERNTLERVFGQPLPLKQAMLLSDMAEKVRDALRENQAQTQHEWQKRNLHTFDPKGQKTAKYKKLREEYSRAMDEFQDQDLTFDGPVAASQLDGMTITPIDLATMKELGLFS